MTDRPFRILFVCTGNTCRSPLAERLARRELEKRGWLGRMEVRSAGVAALPGQGASEGSITVARESGLELEDHRANLLTPEFAAGADLILGMSPGHVARARDLAGEGGARAELLTDFAGDHDSGVGAGVPDPFGGPVEVYRETFRALEALVRDTFRRLEAEVEGGVEG